MLQQERPCPIDVESPTLSDCGGIGVRGTNTLTMLFREDCVLEEALQQLYKSNPESSPLSVVSAGCSVGAEADSLIALHSQSGFGGRLAVTGFDISPVAVKAANTGRYFLPASVAQDEDVFAKTRSTLTDYGFTPDFHNIHRSPDLYRGTRSSRGYYQIGATSLRAGHEVVFTEHDLAEEAPLKGTAHLVVANNVLYHLSPERATRALQNIATILTQNGVLNLGDITLSERTSPWVERNVELLEEEFNLKPIVFGPIDQPVMFARDQLHA